MMAKYDARNPEALEAARGGRHRAAAFPQPVWMPATRRRSRPSTSFRPRTPTSSRSTSTGRRSMRPVQPVVPRRRVRLGRFRYAESERMRDSGPCADRPSAERMRQAMTDQGCRARGCPARRMTAICGAAAILSPTSSCRARARSLSCAARSRTAVLRGIAKPPELRVLGVRRRRSDGRQCDRAPCTVPSYKLSVQPPLAQGKVRFVGELVAMSRRADARRRRGSR